LRVRTVPSGFQPAGRAPAPPPLDLVQDFVNTEIAVWAIDEIATPEALRDWLRGRGLLGDTEVDAESFVRARALRDLLRDLAFRNTHARRSDDELRAAFTSIASDVQLQVQLDDGGDLRLEPAGEGVARTLGDLVARVLEAQASGTWRRMKACPGPHCGWLFYDASRNVSSTWCSMSICGNRTKTAAYRRRQRPAT
jgi:predicted RNA-binding Zn ribbon-like protein